MLKNIHKIPTNKGGKVEDPMITKVIDFLIIKVKKVCLSYAQKSGCMPLVGVLFIFAAAYIHFNIIVWDSWRIYV